MNLLFSTFLFLAGSVSLSSSEVATLESDLADAVSTCVLATGVQGVDSEIIANKGWVDARIAVDAVTLPFPITITGKRGGKSPISIAYLIADKPISECMVFVRLNSQADFEKVGASLNKRLKNKTSMDWDYRQQSNYHLWDTGEHLIVSEYAPSSEDSNLQVSVKFQGKASEQ